MALRRYFAARDSHGGDEASPEPLPAAGLWWVQGREARTLEGLPMFAILAIIFVVLWLGGFLAFHITSAAIHLLLLIAVVLIVLHFVRGRRSV